MPFCSPDKIIVPTGRFRTAEVTDEHVKDIAGSIKEVGQLQPILVSTGMELIDGLNRLRACQLLEREVWWEDEETGRLILNNPLQRRVAELQANTKRREFSPIQLSLAIAEIDKLMRELHGESAGGPNKGTWSQEETAKKMGYKSHGTISTALAVAKAVETGKLPTLERAKTMAEARKMVRDVVRIEAAKELARRQAESSNDTEIPDPLKFFGNRIILGDCITKMKDLQPGICSMFITDPPWKIGADQKVNREGRALQLAQGSYDDSSDAILPMLSALIKEMYRVGKPDCWVVMFCGIKHWYWLFQQFKDSGFSVYEKPLVWTRILSDGSIYNSKSPAPSKWPASVTDFMVLAKKGDPNLAQLNKGDAFLHPIAQPSQRIHQAQKPVGLMQEIISRFYFDGTSPLLIDPFAGSGSTLVAARRVGIKNYLGYELDPEFRDRAIAYLVSSYADEKKIVNTTIDLSAFED